MIAALVFSRDRPAQLDLLLRSLRLNAPGLTPVSVLHRSTAAAFEDGYELCREEHPNVLFIQERDFRTQTVELLASLGSDYVTFLCDDDVLYRPADLRVAVRCLRERELLCFSLRLGRNAIRCYPLRRTHRLPAFTTLDGAMWWDWTVADGDWSYAGSTDGHLFRRSQLLRLITSRTNWSGPNELEDCLNQACQVALLPLMAAYASSVLVGLPLNIVQSSHATNRHGERFHADTSILNDRYLHGARLSLASVKRDLVDAAHVEFPLAWSA